MLNWRMGRWITIAIAVVTALFLLNIVQPLLGISMDYLLMGFKLSTLLGIANGIGAWILYKVL